MTKGLAHYTRGTCKWISTLPIVECERKHGKCFTHAHRKQTKIYFFKKLGEDGSCVKDLVGKEIGRAEKDLASAQRAEKKLVASEVVNLEEG